ncbi:MAG TPA: hypothetical protein VMV93_15060 [Chloroflexota bacterium]|nr:hypothetical protein [Chloroflexota bacterium]
MRIDKPQPRDGQERPLSPPPNPRQAAREQASSDSAGSREAQALLGRWLRLAEKVLAEDDATSPPGNDATTPPPPAAPPASS